MGTYSLPKCLHTFVFLPRPIIDLISAGYPSSSYHSWLLIKAPSQLLTIKPCLPSSTPKPTFQVPFPQVWIGQSWQRCSSQCELVRIDFLRSHLTSLTHMVFQTYVDFELPLTSMDLRVSLISSFRQWNSIRLQAVFSPLGLGWLKISNYRGKGTPRRKVKKVHKSSSTDDKKLQTSLKKLNVQPIQAIEEVNMFKEDGNVIHFAAPKGESRLQTSYLDFPSLQLPLPGSFILLP